MAATIAEFLYPAEQHQRQQEAYDSYVGRIKQVYHKEVLVPLRKCLDIPEVSFVPFLHISPQPVLTLIVISPEPVLTAALFASTAQRCSCHMHSLSSMVCTHPTPCNVVMAGPAFDSKSPSWLAKHMHPATWSAVCVDPLMSFSKAVTLHAP